MLFNGTDKGTISCLLTITSMIFKVYPKSTYKATVKLSELHVSI